MDKTALHAGGSQNGTTVTGGDSGQHERSGAEQTGRTGRNIGNTGDNSNSGADGSGGGDGGGRRNPDRDRQDDAEAMEIASEPTTTTSSSLGSSLGSATNMPAVTSSSSPPMSASNNDTQIKSVGADRSHTSLHSNANISVELSASAAIPFRLKTKDNEPDISVSACSAEQLPRVSPGSSLTTTSSSSNHSLRVAEAINPSLRELVEVSTAAPEDSEQEDSNKKYLEKRKAISQHIEKSISGSYEGKDSSYRPGSYESSEGSQVSEGKISTIISSNFQF